MKKIAVISLGCPKNLVDSETIIGGLEGDFEITNEISLADFIIINTCGFIESAKQESINMILEASGARKDSSVKLIVTGCLAQRYKDEIIAQMPEIDAVVGIGDYTSMLKEINHNQLAETFIESRNNVHNQSTETQVKFSYKNRLISTGKCFAYLKISEGCDNRCTYCAIPMIRGEYCSRPFEEIIDEAKILIAKGVSEIIIIAQDTTYYGMDIYKKRRLAELIHEISKIDGIFWIRLMYAYPEQIGDELIAQFKNNPKLCKYIDIPIQHISDNILKMMGRRGTAKDIKKTISALKKQAPEITIRTTLIVGFPGETEEDFAELYEFVANTEFDKLGVFIYSKEEGTPAAKMKNQITQRIKRQRFSAIMQLQQKISKKLNNMNQNKIFEVLVEGISDDDLFFYGRSYQNAPEIDGCLYFVSEEPIEINKFVKVKILDTTEYDLIGAVLNESAE